MIAGRVPGQSREGFMCSRLMLRDTTSMWEQQRHLRLINSEAAIKLLLNLFVLFIAPLQVLMGFLREELGNAELPLMISYEAKSMNENLPVARAWMEKRWVWWLWLDFIFSNCILYFSDSLRLLSACLFAFSSGYVNSIGNTNDGFSLLRAERIFNDRSQKRKKVEEEEKEDVE